MDAEARNLVDQLLTAIADARTHIATATDLINKSTDQVKKYRALAQRAQQIADESLALASKRNATLIAMRERVLETAVTLERKQLYYAHHDSYDHDLLRIANEQLNGVYAVMPAVFGKTQKECIEMVRETAAEVTP